MKAFHVTGKCYPERHYMADITERLDAISRMVEHGDYFCINRGRQYGKTTTLFLLKRRLEREYCVFSVSFEGMGEQPFLSPEKLAAAFFWLLKECIEFHEVKNLADDAEKLIRGAVDDTMREIPMPVFSSLISRICMKNAHNTVLLIDEVDQAGAYPAFLSFLGVLRELFLNRDSRPAFQSVILSGVYDIKNLKLKIRPEELHRYNSPWNIATDFKVDMSLSPQGIRGMLLEYRKDHIGLEEERRMEVEEMTELLYSYTSGHPFLVSRLCQMIDEGKRAWDKQGFLEALKDLLAEENTLFDDIQKKLSVYSELRDMLYHILFEGKQYVYSRYHPAVEIAEMFGYVTDRQNQVSVANRIFEIWIYNLFLADEQLHAEICSESSRDKHQFVHNGVLDMQHILERFVVHFHDIYGDSDEKYVEKMGRKLFLLYLKPIINGVGNYYVEAHTRDDTRTDVIIDYLGSQYVIEMKIWRGQAYHQRGEQQLLKYLDYYHIDQGYLLSFCFNSRKECGVRTLKFGKKQLIEAVV